MKLRHNKKRNTAFLYEALVRELTKAIIRKDVKYKKKIALTIKESFGKTTELKKELDLYKSLQENQNLKPYLAEKLIYEVRAQYKKINKKKIFNEQSNLINKINRTLSKRVFSHYVPNYKNIATIYQVFNDELLPKKRVLLEDTMLGWLTGKEKENEGDFPTINNLVIKRFVENFNDQYNSILLREQKELLQKYIFSFADNGIEFKLFLNEELSRLKKIIKKGITVEEIKNDPDMGRRSKEVLKLMETFKEAPVCAGMIKKIIKIQNLVSEIQS
jgi:hypothetical protein